MPQIYEYTYFSQQKRGFADDLRRPLNLTLTEMRQGRFNTPKKVAGNGQKLVKTKVNMTSANDVWECRIDGHWRVFYYTNPGGGITALCIGHLDDNNRLMMP